MFTGDIAVKPFLTFDQFNNYVEFVAQNYFDEEGKYVPYNAREAMYIGFLMFCTDMEGVNFEKDYEKLRVHTTLINKYEESCRNYEYFKEVHDCAKDMADHEKNKRIHSFEMELGELISAINKKVNEFNLEEYTEKILDFIQTSPQEIVSEYMKEYRDKGFEDVLNYKNEIIRQLKNQSTMKNVQENLENDTAEEYSEKVVDISDHK